MSYLGNALQNFGGSVQGLGQTIYVADADRKYKDEALAIAQDIDAFTKGLYTDPNHGVPGSTDEAGYMGKWDEFSKQIQERVDKVANPLAKKNLGEYWGRTALEQKSKVYDVQYKAWASDTVSAADRRIMEMIRTGGARGQDAFDYAQQELDALLDKNLISEDERQTRMASLSQVIIRKGLTDEAKAIHAKKGLAAALKFIADDDLAYTGAMRSFMAGDEVKALVSSDIKEYHALEQDEIFQGMEKESSYYTLSDEAKKEAVKNGLIPLTHDRIDESNADPDKKIYWHDRLSGYMRVGAGSEDDKAIGYTVANHIITMAYAIQRGQTTDGKPYITLTDPLTGKPKKYPVNDVGGARQMMVEFRGYLDGIPGMIEKLEKLLNDTGQANFGAWAENRQAIDAIKDPALRGQASVQFEALRAQYPDANAEKVGEMVRSLLSTKVYKEKVTGRFMPPVMLFPGDEDKIVTMNWDGEFKYDVAAAPGSPLRPMASQSREALASFEAASQKEVVDAFEKMYPGVKLVFGENLQLAWEPTDRGEGINDLVFRVTGESDNVISFRPVPVIIERGAREAGFVMQKYNKKGDTVETFVQDPKTKEFISVDPLKAKQRDGWALPAVVSATTPPASTARATARGEEEPAATVAWPARKEDYPMPAGIKAREWKDTSLEDRKAWYKDNRYTWNGSKFIKAGK